MCVSQLKQLAEAARFYTFGICLHQLTARRTEHHDENVETRGLDVSPALRPLRPWR